MRNQELLDYLESVSCAISVSEYKELIDLVGLRYWNALLHAAREIDIESRDGVGHFCLMLAKFIRSNFEFYTMPENTLTGMAPDGGEDAF